MTSHDSDALWALARGSLSAQDTLRVRAHVSECEHCARLLAQMEAAASTLMPPAPPVLEDAVWNKLDREVLMAAETLLDRRASRARAGRLSWAFVGAGALAAALLILTVLRRVPNGPESPRATAPSEVQRSPEAPRATTPAQSTASELALLRMGSLPESKIGEGAQVATGPSEEARLVLRKARLIALSGSLLTLAELRAERTRLSLERGTVVVAANPRERGALSIVAGQAEVLVVGTQFSVARDDAQTVHIAVREGELTVRTAHTQRTVSAASAVTLRGEEWTVRAPSRAEKDTLERLDEPEVAPGPVRPVHTAPRDESKVGPGLPETVEPAPEVMPEAPRAEPAAEPDAPPVQPEPGPAATEAAAQPKPDWRVRGLKDLPGAVSDHLPEALKPAPAHKLDQDEYLVRKMERLAGSGDCKAALAQAEQWQKSHPGAASDDARQKTLQEAVQAVRERCQK